MKIVKQWFEFLNQDDLSQFMKTENLLNSWYLLSNKDVSLLFDASKPRILKIWTHGIFGTLQDIIYDVDPMDLRLGMWGVVPSYMKDGKCFFPFRVGEGGFDIPPKDRLFFEPEKKRIKFRNIPTWDENSTRGEPINFSVSLDNTNIKVEIDAARDAEETKIWTPFYPLYNYFKTADIEELLDIEYYTVGVRATYSPHFNEILGAEVSLLDSYGRMPAVKLHTEGKLRLKSMCDPEYGNAFRLHTEAISAGNRILLNISLSPNPIVTNLPPIIAAQVRRMVEICAPSSPRVKVDGKEMAITKRSKESYMIEISVEPGRHSLEVASQEARMRRTFYATPDPEYRLVAMGDAISRIGWNKPKIKNLLPYIVKLDGLEATSRDGMAYCAHSLRVIPALVTATLITGKRAYVDRAYEYLSAGASRAHRTKKGALFLPLILDMQGKVPERYRFASRPSDVGLQARGWLYAGRVYKTIGIKEMADKCFAYAMQFARLLLEMQRPDGSFASRYRYPDLLPNKKAEGGAGTVNPWIIHIWETADVAQDFDPKNARKLKRMCEQYVDWLWNEETVSLKTSIGGEMRQDLLAATGPGVLALLIKYLATGDRVWAERTRQAMKMVAYLTMQYIDQPQNFFYLCARGLPKWYNQPNLFCQGGMLDLEITDAAQAVSRYLNDDFAEKVLRSIFFDRLVGTVQDDGCVRGLDITVPNYTYIKRDLAEPLNYGAVGIAGYYYVVNFLSRKGESL